MTTTEHDLLMADVRTYVAENWSDHLDLVPWEHPWNGDAAEREMDFLAEQPDSEVLEVYARLKIAAEMEEWKGKVVWRSKMVKKLATLEADLEEIRNSMPF